MSDVRPALLGPITGLPSGGYRIEITTEESIETARHKRWRDTVLFGTALAMFVAAFSVSLWFAFLAPAPDAETRKAAVGIVITLVGALGGFLGGRATK